jgi:hypothetical protein
LTLLLFCPCFFIHSFLWLHVDFLSGSESEQFFLSFVDILWLEIQLSRWMGWVHINLVTFKCLSQARTWISNVICRGLFLCSVSESERLLAIRIVDHHCLNFLFIIINEFVKKRRVTRRVPLVAHEQLNLPEHLNSTRLLIVEFPCVVVCRSLFVFPSFFF